MAGAITLQAQVPMNQMKFEKGTVTFTTDSADADITVLHPEWGAPKGIIYLPVGDCATNEEQLSLGTFNTSTGVQPVQRDGLGALTDAGVITYMLIWAN